MIVIENHAPAALVMCFDTDPALPLDDVHSYAFILGYNNAYWYIYTKITEFDKACQLCG